MKSHFFSLSIRVIILVLLAYAVVRESAHIFALKNQTTELISEAQRQSGTDSETQYIRMLQSESAKDIARIEASALTRSRLVDLITEIEHAGRDLGLTLTISSIHASTQSASTSPATVRLAVETNGTWSANLTLVHLMQHLPYKISVDESRLTLVNNGWKGNTGLTVTVLPQ